MRVLVFEVAGERYGIELKRVVEVIRWPEMRNVAGVPPWILGLLARGSQWVPIIDTARLIDGSPTPEVASSRVALVEYVSAQNQKRIIGLLAPGMTRILDLGDAERPGLFLADRPYLGQVLMNDERGVQIVDPVSIIPIVLESMLFSPELPDAKG